MDAINRAYPIGYKETHGVKRVHNDMSPLYSLPGQPFQSESFAQPALHQSIVEEGEWLERELGWSFPSLTHRSLQSLWQPETLSALQFAINRIDSRHLRVVAKNTLIEESARLQPSAPDSAAVLRFIAGTISERDEPPTELILEKLGADYFKFSALQVESASSEMSLLLMLLAHQLRPNAPFMEERIRHYRSQIKGS